MNSVRVEVKVYVGSSVQAEHACRSEYVRTPFGILLEQRVDDARVFGETRNLLAQLRHRLGDSKFESVIARNRPVASFLFSRILENLTPEEKRERASMSARLTSHLTHNWYIERPFYEKLAKLLSEMFTECDEPPKIFIPLFNRTSQGTFAVLRNVMKLFPDAQFSLFIGYAPDENFSRLDADGIRWGTPKELVDRMMQSLCATGTAERVDVNSILVDAKCREVPALVDPLDENIDEKIRRDLETCPEAILTPMLMGVVLNAFEAFDRDVALFLAREAVRKIPALSRSELAKLHNIVGLCAHGRQFDTSAGDEKFNATLAENFELALRNEDDSVLGVCLRYRLAVAEGRRRKNIEVAFEHVAKAIEQIPSLPVEAGLRAYLESWSRNIRAYIHMRRGSFEKALEDMEGAYACLDRSSSEDWSLERENKFVRVLLILNLETLCRISKNDERMRFWLDRLYEIEEKSIELTGARMTANSRITYLRGSFDIDSAIRTALHALTDARNELHPRYEYNHTTILGLLYYMQGDLEASLRSFQESCRLATRLMLEEEAGPLEVLTQTFYAVAASRCADLQPAISKFQDLVAFHEKSPSKRALLGALTGLAGCHARGGNRKEADDTMNRAIELAVESGRRDDLVEICCAAGEALLVMQRNKEASDAFARGIALSRIEVGDVEVVATAWQAVRLCLGAFACGQARPWMLDRIVRAAPEALRQSAEAWWELPRLFALVKERRSEVAMLTAGDPAVAASLEKLSKAFSQRVETSSLGLPATSA